MTDYTELKRLAETANAVTGDVSVDIAISSERGPNQPEIDAVTAFVGAATPTALLALIAENERLKTLRSTTERDLTQELEVWRQGPSCWTCGDTGDVHDIIGEWRGQCDCNAAKLIDAASERDQLKAENAAALREATDLALAIWRRRYATESPNFKPFEKASSVIGQIDNMAAGLMCDQERLKAENEALRKNAKRYQWLREARRGYIEVVEWIGPHATGMTGEELDALLDAAMGKGEQS